MTTIDEPLDPLPDQLCANCHQRPGTVAWTGDTGDTGALGFSFGMYELWCPLCAAEASLAYARKQAARIPALEAQIRELENE